jgi:putative tryptophan/tyrosine transport system substrate-binding protein
LRRGGVAGGGARTATEDACDRFLATSPPEATKAIVANFRSGLRDAGFVEDKNVTIEFRWSDDRHVLAEMAADLVWRKVDVIFASGAAAAVFAAKTATSTVPIVFEGALIP